MDGVLREGLWFEIFFFFIGGKQSSCFFFPFNQNSASAPFLLV